MPRFHVTMTVEAEVEISDEAIKIALSKDWQAGRFGGTVFHKPADAATYIMRFIAPALRDQQLPAKLGLGEFTTQVLSEEWDVFVEKVRPKRAKAEDK